MEMELKIPPLAELSFRQTLLADPETMRYNEKWGGALSFPEEKWASWYARWVAPADRSHFYRYLHTPEDGFVGDAAYHYDEELGVWLADVIILAAFRGRGYGRAGLRLLCAAARGNGLKTLCDTIALDNAPALALFQSEGFCETRRTEEYALVELQL